MTDKTLITVEADVAAPVDIVWECWNSPEHITQWNAASEDWHSPRATVDLQEGGNFSIRMEAKDESVGFDFNGTYDKIVDRKSIEYTMEDERKVSIKFEEENGKTHITETFEPESENSLETQKEGWQAILDSFKKYAELQAR